jgi:SDR family mycofactocin-dependent oxidoreductase
VGRLDGKVVVISGGARGQGRSHAVTLAREGASIVVFDVCAPFEYPMHPASTEDDLQETVRLVEEQDQRCLAVKADARDSAAMRAVAERTMAEFGRVDILLVNHGIWSVAENLWEIPDAMWDETIEVCLTAAWKVVKAFVPRIIEGERGGSVVITSSANGLIPAPSWGHYAAAKTGVLGLMRTLAVEAGPYNIRVNSIAPGAIATPMMFEGGTIAKASEWRPEIFGTNHNLLPIDNLEPRDISNAILWLVSDEGRYVTGVTLSVDGGRAVPI